MGDVASHQTCRYKMSVKSRCRHGSSSIAGEREHGAGLVCRSGTHGTVREGGHHPRGKHLVRSVLIDGAELTVEASPKPWKACLSRLTVRPWIGSELSSAGTSDRTATQARRPARLRGRTPNASAASQAMRRYPALWPHTESPLGGAARRIRRFQSARYLRFRPRRRYRLQARRMTRPCVDPLCGLKSGHSRVIGRPARRIALPDRAAFP